MKTTRSWGWARARSDGVWTHGCRWARPLCAAAPWVAFLLVLFEFSLIEGRMSASSGLIVNLPEPIAHEDEAPTLTACVLRVSRSGSGGDETFIFFDDARYQLGSPSSLNEFRTTLAQQVQHDRKGALLLLADARVALGDTMKIVSLAREAGVSHVQIAERPK